MPGEDLTTAQRELYEWLVDFIAAQHHSPSIRQMMQAMGLRSPAPIQSRLRHLQEKGWIKWQEGQGSNTSIDRREHIWCPGSRFNSCWRLS
tara:strand:+ start:1401 stop:1673 length:273 start_codon:yes stop_codon:yes gene_type:complete